MSLPFRGSKVEGKGKGKGKDKGEGKGTVSRDAPADEGDDEKLEISEGDLRYVEDANVVSMKGKFYT